MAETLTETIKAFLNALKKALSTQVPLLTVEYVGVLLATVSPQFANHLHIH